MSRRLGPKRAEIEAYLEDKDRTIEALQAEVQRLADAQLDRMVATDGWSNTGSVVDTGRPSREESLEAALRAVEAERDSLAERAEEWRQAALEAEHT